jgi:hypothetical protein
MLPEMPWLNDFTSELGKGQLEGAFRSSPSLAAV